MSIANGFVLKPWRVKRATSTFGDEKYPSVVSTLVRPRVDVTVARAVPCVAVPESFLPFAFSVKTIGFGKPGVEKRTVPRLRVARTCACATCPGPSVTVAVLRVRRTVTFDVSALRKRIVPEYHVAPA